MQHTTTIKVLPQTVVEKIAAGEVVERPGSVLKELIENSIDASATRIDVFLEDAGFSLIKVVDNGQGMSSEDLRLCLLPHATSKISSADDLYSIATMGFRGEALGSIAAVSRIQVESSSSEDGLGFRISSDGGAVHELLPCPHNRGTTVSVRDLFFNVPARKKFMKTHRGEQLACMRFFEQIAIPFPSVHFSLSIDNKKVLEFPIASSPLERIGAVAGNQFARRLIECRGSRPGMEALIYVSSPEDQKEKPRFNSLFVNLRRIDNDSVTFAVREAFSQFLGFSFRPSFFCFLDIDPSRIDVNVHPTKQQVKFDNERDLFGFIFSTVKSSITSTMVQPGSFLTGETPSSVPPPAWDSSPLTCFSGASGGMSTFSVREQPPETPGSSQTILPFPGSSYEPSQKEVDPPQQNGVQLTSEERDERWDLIPCYQIHSLFVLAPIKNGILIIDQHAAHERVLYEQALEDLKRGRAASQQLLFPIVLELTATEKAVIESARKYLQSFGFEIEDFGGQAVSISAIPAFLKDGAVKETVTGIVKYLLEGKDPQAFLEPEKRFAAAFACGAAIKAGQKLTQEEMNALLNSLFSAKNPYICPHGRPTLVRISIDELSRRFLR